MNIVVNSNNIEFTQNNLSELLVQIQMSEKKGIAIALNNSVVTKANWQKTQLKENDKITIITATQGG